MSKKITAVMTVAAALCAIMLTGCGNGIPKDAKLIYEKIYYPDSLNTYRETFIYGDHVSSIIYNKHGHFGDPVIKSSNTFGDDEITYENKYESGEKIYSKEVSTNYLKQTKEIKETKYTSERDDSGNLWLHENSITYDAETEELLKTNKVSYLYGGDHDIYIVGKYADGDKIFEIKYDGVQLQSEYKDEYDYTQMPYDNLCFPVLNNFRADPENAYYYTYKYDESGKLIEYTVWPITKKDATFNDLKKYQVEYDKKAEKISIVDANTNAKVAVYEYKAKLDNGSHWRFIINKCSFGPELKDKVWVTQTENYVSYYSNSDTFPPCEQILWDRFGCEQFGVFN